MGDKINENNPTYPNGEFTGMDIRTKIAVEAMNGILSGAKITFPLSIAECTYVAQSAVFLTDTLLEILNQSK